MGYSSLHNLQNTEGVEGSTLCVYRWNIPHCTSSIRTVPNNSEAIISMLLLPVDVMQTVQC